MFVSVYCELNCTIPKCSLVLNQLSGDRKTGMFVSVYCELN